MNDSGILEFLLLGISEDPGLQPVLFGLFLSMYLITVLGNLLIILATVSDPRLHTPMYFFLCNLSWVDVGLTSSTIPKMLLNLHTDTKVITFGSSLTQMDFFLLFVGLDNFLLTVMAYDRYVAICHPLRYAAIMSPRLCALLVLCSWLVNVFNSTLHSLLVLRLSFCAQVAIPHFFCEVNQVAHRACSDTFLNDLLMNCAVLLLVGGPLAGILYSYYKIFSSIRAMASTQGKHKAFSTCASHLSVVSLFYCTVLGVYLSSAMAPNSHSMTTASVMYSVVTPMLNPFLYSLRNRDLKNALRRLMEVERMKSAIVGV
ncbi:olfactory receptor 7A10-like [Thomomys bottae]